MQGIITPSLVKRARAETMRLAKETRDVSGTALIEFAFVMPLLFAMLVGMFVFGIAINNYIRVTDGAAAGVLQLTIDRGSAAATPLTDTKNAVYAAAPTLTKTSLTISVSINGTACTTDAACNTALNAAAGNSATVTVSYPCTLQVLEIDYLPNCTLAASPTGRIQ